MSDTSNIVKTGTTILGIVCKDGVVMAGDNRSSLGGQIIYSKSAEKLEKINDYLIMAGAGAAVEIQKVSKLLPAELKLKQLQSKKRPTVRESASLLSNIQVQHSGFILGGFDENKKASVYDVLGGHLQEITDFTANIGSGMPYVLGYLERNWKQNLTVEEGVKMAVEAIKASSARDMGSGNGIDVYTITKEGIKKVISQTVENTYKEKQ